MLALDQLLHERARIAPENLPDHLTYGAGADFLPRPRGLIHIGPPLLTVPQPPTLLKLLQDRQDGAIGRLAPAGQPFDHTVDRALPLIPHHFHHAFLQRSQPREWSAFHRWPPSNQYYG